MYNDKAFHVGDLVSLRHFCVITNGVPHATSHADTIYEKDLVHQIIYHTFARYPERTSSFIVVYFSHTTLILMTFFGQLIRFNSDTSISYFGVCERKRINYEDKVNWIKRHEEIANKEYQDDCFVREDTAFEIVQRVY